eukprot:764816-Hanusia_phi.AAC.1
MAEVRRRKDRNRPSAERRAGEVAARGGYLHALVESLSNALPFTKKGAVILINGKPAVESLDGQACQEALLAVRFRGKICAEDVEEGRYFLLVSYGDPWSQRTLIAHGLAGLQGKVGVLATDGASGHSDEGLAVFQKDTGLKVSISSLHLACFLTSARPWKVAESRPILSRQAEEWIRRVTIPALWDSKTGRIINNESGEIVRILHQTFSGLGENGVDLYPSDLHEEIEKIRQIVYKINAGVYKCGYSAREEAYRGALVETFRAMDACELLLKDREFLAGDRITELDVMAFPTLIRFDLSGEIIQNRSIQTNCSHANVSNFGKIYIFLSAASLLFLRAVSEAALHRFAIAHFIETRWKGRTVGNALRLLESIVDICTGAAVPGSGW